MNWSFVIANAITLACIYGTLAIGLSITWSSLGLVNMAYGFIFALSGYGAWLAAQTGAPVLPVAHNSGQCWGRNAFLKYPGLITVSIGEPITAREASVDTLNARVEHWIESEIERMGTHS